MTKIQRYIRKELSNSWKAVLRWFSKATLLERAAGISGIVLFMVGLVWGFATRVVAVFHYTDFLNDQAVQAQQVRDLFDGTLLTLGPGASVGGYALPPLYYYVNALFAAASADPVWPAFMNALLSWLALILLFVVVVVGLAHVGRAQRLFFGGLATLWASTLSADIVMANRAWNPNSIPFFLLLNALAWLWVERVFTKQRNAHGVGATSNANEAVKTQGLATQFSRATLPLWLPWIVIGILLGIWVSLHSVTLFIMPFVFIAMSALLVWKHRVHWVYPIGSAIVSLLSVTPYWIGESARGFTNTRSIVGTMLGGSGSETQHSILQMIDRALWSFTELGRITYFSEYAPAALLTSALLCVAVVGIIWYHGNSILGWFFGITWLLFLGVSSQYWGELYIHYVLVELHAPILLCVAALAYSKPWPARWLIRILFVAIVILSLSSNITQGIRYMNAKFSAEHLLSSKETAEAMSHILPGSQLCSAQSATLAYAYIDKHITQQGLTIVSSMEECGEKGTYLIEPRCGMFENLLSPISCEPFRTDMHPQKKVLRETESYTIVVQE